MMNSLLARLLLAVGNNAFSVKKSRCSKYRLFSPRLRVSAVKFFSPPKTQNPPFSGGVVGWARPASLRLREPGLVLLFDAVEFRQQMMIRICLQRQGGAEPALSD